MSETRFLMGLAAVNIALNIALTLYAIVGIREILRKLNGRKKDD